MASCKIYLVRHGESEHNRDEIVSGQVNPKLTDVGEAQAADTKQKLANIKFDDVYSSDLQRASHTAEIIFGTPVPPDHQLKNLRERHFGPFEGKHNRHLREVYAKNQDKFMALSAVEQWRHKNHPDMESDAEVADRFMAALADIAERNMGKTILVAAHGGTLRTTLIKLGYATSKQLPGGSIANAAYVELDYIDGSFRIGATNGVNRQQ